MSIVVTKSSPEVVVPSDPETPTGHIQLSSFDKFLCSVPVPLLLVFDKPIHHPVDTIKRAMSQALVHYYPIAGRLAAGADGGEVITCKGDGEEGGRGVLFVGASASGAVDDVVSSPALLKDLFLRYPEEEFCCHADPLLLMQVTEFSCGGFAVGVTWNHVLADGAGMGQFLQALGELARGVPSVAAIVPVRSDDSVLAAPPPRGSGGVASIDWTCAECTTEGMAFLDLTISSSFISGVKATIGKPCTAFEVIVALLWQCRARAVDCPAESPASLVFGYNMRALVGAAAGYYGNCLIQVSVVATSGEVAKGEMKDVVTLIQTAKKKIGDETKKGDVVVVEQEQLQLGYNTLMVSSWRNLGLEAPDFGSGRPARVMWYEPQFSMPFFAICPPCKGSGGDGVNVLGYIVKKEHLDAFMHQIQARLAATTVY
uniref:Uncharacterized protein n=1 Tax=Avena sativa TaxID=4498 RepID=A0ACD5WUY8_AVESA